MGKSGKQQERSGKTGGGVGRGHGEEDVPGRENDEGRMRTAYRSSGTLPNGLDYEPVDRVRRR